jgi:hypothetical protein
MFYAVYVTATGALFSTGSQVADTLPDGLSSKSYAQPVDLRLKVWDAATLDFVDRPPVERTRLTPDEFWDRLTGAELVAIEAASWAATNPAAQVRTAVKALDRAEVLDVSLARIRAALQVFVDRGLITAPRMNEIIAPVVTP